MEDQDGPAPRDEDLSARPEYVVTLDRDSEVDGWAAVSGGGLPQDIQVKFQIIAARIAITGVMIDNGRRITAQSLRAPRLSDIEAAVSYELRRHRQDIADYRATGEEVLDDPQGHHEHAKIAVADAEAWQFRLDQALARVTAQQGPHAKPFRARGRGAPPPSDDDYLAFAAVYLRKLAERPRGVKTAVARQTHMHRTTVHTWIRECQERGYLPPEENK